MKSYQSWMVTRQWCLDNPRRKAAIVTPDGTFEIVYVPREAPTVVFDELADVPHDWLKKRFIKP